MMGDIAFLFFCHRFSSLILDPVLLLYTMSTKNISLESLAASITANVRTVTEYLNDNKLPQPSFSADGPQEIETQAKAEVARIALIEAANALAHLASGPAEFLRHEVMLVGLPSATRVRIC
jgi:hypothetical protein